MLTCNHILKPGHMKIVVLDGYTLNPGDLSWKNFEELGELKVYKRTSSDLIYKRSRNAEIILTTKTPLTKQLIKKLNKLKYIGVLGTGYDNVNIAEATKKGIPVTNVPTYGTSAVSQMVFAHLLEFCRHVKFHSNMVKNKGQWVSCKDFCFWERTQIELTNKTIGIVGFGRIGEKVAQIAETMGMNILVTDPKRKQLKKVENFEWVKLDKLLASSDVISLHCPLTKETEGMINKDSIKLMKSSAFLINTSRGGLIVEPDLAEALNNKLLAGAGLDVLSKEPPQKDNPLLSAKNCIITPHIAWATLDARVRLLETAKRNLESFINSKPINVVNDIQI